MADVVIGHYGNAYLKYLFRRPSRALPCLASAHIKALENKCGLNTISTAKTFAASIGGGHGMKPITFCYLGIDNFFKVGQIT